MFQMTVKDAMQVHNNLISVMGPCLNKKAFLSGRLVDEKGNVYDAHVPFDKPLVTDDTSVVLGIYGIIDAKSLIGRTLTSA